MSNHHHDKSNKTDQHSGFLPSLLPRKKKTREEVQHDLLEKLRQDARNQLDQEGISLDTDFQLDKALYQIAALHFQRSYDYVYDNNPTNCHPSQLAPNGNIVSLAMSCSMKPEDISSTLQSFVRTVMGQANLHGEIKDKAGQDLVDVARMALGDPMSNDFTWKDQSYTRTFEVSEEDDPSGQRNSTHVDGILVYCNARLKEDDQDVSLCTLYYMAMYYDVMSEFVKKKAQFQNDALSDAKGFSNCNSRLRSDSDLKNALERYAQSLFRNKFDFDYSNESPPDLAKNVSASDVQKYLGLYSSNESKEEWFFDVAREYFDALVEDQYETIKSPAVKELAKTLVDFSQNATGAQWESKPFDHLYQLPRAQTRFSGYIFYYRKEGKTNQDRDVSITYVFILGVLYKTSK